MDFALDVDAITAKQNEPSEIFSNTFVQSKVSLRLGTYKIKIIFHLSVCF